MIYKSINKYLNYDFLHCHGAPQWLIGVSFGFQGDRTRSQYLLDRARLIPLIMFVHLSLLTRPLTHHISSPYSKTLFQLICYPTHIFKGNAVKITFTPSQQFQNAVALKVSDISKNTKNRTDITVSERFATESTDCKKQAHSYGGHSLVLLVLDEGAGEDLQLPQVGSHVLCAVLLGLQREVALK